jgi:hypothetical protein
VTFTSETTTRAPSRPAVDAAMHGYTVAFWVAAGVFAIGAVVVGSLMHSLKIEAVIRGRGRLTGQNPCGLHPHGVMTRDRRAPRMPSSRF